MKTHEVSNGTAVAEQMVIRRGDGTLLCDRHYAQEHPDTPEPVYGWELGVCDLCCDD